MKSILIINYSGKLFFIFVLIIGVVGCKDQTSNDFIIPREKMEAILYDYFIYLHTPIQQPLIQPSQFQEVTFFVLKKHHVDYISITKSYKHYMELGVISEILDDLRKKIQKEAIAFKTEKSF